MITDDKITEIFCATDEFSKKFDEEIENMPLLTSDGKTRRRRAASMSDSEIMTILIMFHFGTFDNFKHYYLHFIRIHLRRDFPDAVSYNRFVELESRVFFKMMFFHEPPLLRAVHWHHLRGLHHDTRMPQPAQVCQQGFRRSCH